tara:strand:- start:804 stop:1325 length:522 start_codon:yes stop_codon:yes gene_type:complete
MNDITRMLEKAITHVPKGNRNISATQTMAFLDAMGYKEAVSKRKYLTVTSRVKKTRSRSKTFRYALRECVDIISKKDTDLEINMDSWVLYFDRVFGEIDPYIELWLLLASGDDSKSVITTGTPCEHAWNGCMKMWSYYMIDAHPMAKRLRISLEILEQYVAREIPNIMEHNDT